MEKFTNFIGNIPKEVSHGGRGVKVAVLDDGIDVYEGGFGDSIKDGVSFLKAGQEQETRPHCFSTSGHGTEMAKLIRRVCPPVQLYIARLHHRTSHNGRNLQPTPESAAKASIKYAPAILD